MVRLTNLTFPLYSVLLAPSGVLRKTDEKYGNLIIHLSENLIHPDISWGVGATLAFHKVCHILAKNINKSKFV